MVRSSKKHGGLELDYVGRALTQGEMKKIGYIIPQANLGRSKHLSEGYIPLEEPFSFLTSNTPKASPFSDHTSNPLCIQYTCKYERESFRIFKTDNNRTAKKQQAQVEGLKKKPSEVCYVSGYDCEIKMVMMATFNCVGWAIGISKFISTVETIASSSPKSMLKELISKMRDEYNDSHPSNFGHIVDKLLVLDSLPNPIANNTIAFYFKDGYIAHAARYITSVNGVEVNQWTSKMGFGAIVTHDELSISDNLYGRDIYYVGVADDHSACQILA